MKIALSVTSAAAANDADCRSNPAAKAAFIVRFMSVPLVPGLRSPPDRAARAKTRPRRPDQINLRPEKWWSRRFPQRAVEGRPAPASHHQLLVAPEPEAALEGVRVVATAAVWRQLVQPL